MRTDKTTAHQTATSPSLTGCVLHGRAQRHQSVLI